MMSRMSRGRPKEFDRDQALQLAVELFWEKGYQATSLDDLLDRMNIGRQSLYDTFGDKQSLFCEAIDRYHTTVAGQLSEILQAEGSPCGNLRNLLEAVVNKFGDGQCRGCMVVNASIEFAGTDPENPIMKALKRTFNSLEKQIKKTLKNGVIAGELPNDFDVSRWATFLTASFQGMLVMAKTGGSRAALRRVADTALSVLPTK